MTKLKTMPVFKVDKKCSPPKVSLHCSECDVFLRELKMGETIKVDRGYYCEKCCPENVIVINPGKENKCT